MKKIDLDWQIITKPRSGSVDESIDRMVQTGGRWGPASFTVSLTPTCNSPPGSTPRQLPPGRTAALQSAAHTWYRWSREDGTLAPVHGPCDLRWSLHTTSRAPGWPEKWHHHTSVHTKQHWTNIQWSHWQFYHRRKNKLKGRLVKKKKKIKDFNLAFQAGRAKKDTLTVWVKWTHFTTKLSYLLLGDQWDSSDWMKRKDVTWHQQLN